MPIFLGGFQFAHISEADISSAFDDVVEGRVDEFRYTLPRSHMTDFLTNEMRYWWPPNAHSFSNMSREYGWTEEPRHYFNAIEMGVLLAHRHGTLCSVCCNIGANRWSLSDVRNEITFGANGNANFLFGNFCEHCHRLRNISDESLVDFFAKEVRKKKKPSEFLERLRMAPPLRIQPQRKAA